MNQAQYNASSRQKKSKSIARVSRHDLSKTSRDKGLRRDAMKARMENAESTELNIPYKPLSHS
jgi:hypothetical protein